MSKSEGYGKGIVGGNTNELGVKGRHTTLEDFLRKASNDNWRGAFGMLDLNPEYVDMRPESSEYAAIHFAVSKGKVQKVKKLVEFYGANPALLNQKRETPSDMAKSALERHSTGDEKKRYKEIAKFLAAESKRHVIDHWHKSTSSLARKYELVVVGGGPAGVTAAGLAGYLGRRVLLVDDPGAVPVSELDGEFGAPTGLFSKALRDAIKHFDVKELRSSGMLVTPKQKEDLWAKVTGFVQKLALANAESRMKTMAELRVDYLRAVAKIAKAGEVIASIGDPNVSKNMLEDKSISTDYILVATGSVPRRLESIPFDDKRVFDSDTISRLRFLPESIVISGTGIIAIEYAQIFSRLGAHVTMLARGETSGSLTRLGLDEDIVEALLGNLEACEVTIRDDTSVDDILVPESSGDPLTIKITSDGKPDQLKSAVYMAAIGRIPNTEGLGLEGCGVELDGRGRHMVVNSQMRSESTPNIYGAGDVIGNPALASTSEEQARLAVLDMFGDLWKYTQRKALLVQAHGYSTIRAFDKPDKCARAVIFEIPSNTEVLVTGESGSFRKVQWGSQIGWVGIKHVRNIRSLPSPEAAGGLMENIPIGIWTEPEIGYFGFTKADAEKAGIDADEASARYSSCLRGRVFAPLGFLKLVFDVKTGRIVGVHIFGADACELIQCGMEMVLAKRTIFDVMQLTTVAVTYSELFKRAAILANSRLKYDVRWRSLFHDLMKATGDLETLKNKFDELDGNRDGALGLTDFKKLCQSHGTNIEEDVLQAMIDLSDQDDDSKISFSELQGILRGMGEVAAAL